MGSKMERGIRLMAGTPIVKLSHQTMTNNSKLALVTDGVVANMIMSLIVTELQIVNVPVLLGRHSGDLSTIRSFYQYPVRVKQLC